MILNLFNIRIQLRNILHIYRNEKFLITWNLQQLFRFTEPFQRNPAQHNLVIPFSVCDFKLYMVIVILGEDPVVKLRNQLVQILLPFLAFHHMGKAVVLPQDTPILQRDCIRDCQFLQQRILNPFILGRKLDQIRQNQGPVVKIQKPCNHQIDYDKDRHHKACPLVNHVHPDIHGYQQHRHNQRPLHIHPKLPLQSHILFTHGFLPHITY